MKMAYLLAFAVVLLSACGLASSRSLPSVTTHGADAQLEGGRAARAKLEPPTANADKPPELGIGDDGAVQSEKKKRHAKAPPKHHGPGKHAPPADLSPPAPDPDGGQPPEPEPGKQWPPLPAWPEPGPGEQWPPFPAWPQPDPGKQWPPFPAWPQPEPGKQWPPFPFYPPPMPSWQWPPALSFHGQEEQHASRLAPPVPAHN
uniref:Proline-rich protein n=1 Tax=Aegilops tauschii TaxID=37682 RepID=M8AX54_AEGTA